MPKKKEEQKQMSDRDKLLAALRRKAFGYTYDERTAEFDAEGNETKNKITTKEVPPDLSAIKLLLELRGEEEPSEEELEAEKARIIELLFGKLKEKLPPSIDRKG